MKTGENMSLKSKLRSKPGVLALGIILLLGATGFGVARAGQQLLSSHGIKISLKLASPNEPPTTLGFAPVVKSILPNVVNVSTSKTVHTSLNQFQGQEVPPFFQQFFGQDFGQDFQGNGQPQKPRDQREESLGSGVIVSADGYILTNNHVVDGASDVRVTFSNKHQVQAKVIGTDPKTDIAVLKVEGNNYPAITIGDSSKVQVGDYALAVGNPFGVGQTVTMGIVSAMNRGNLGIEDYEDFIQTDAPINPGNSGGALVNDRGELIGINTAILSHGSGGNQGIGFAVPVNMARNVMEQILDHGKVNRAYLGVMAQDITPALSKAMGLTEQRGVLVGDVTPSSPAQHSGLQRGDIILEVNGTPMLGSNELRNIISQMRPDATVKLKVLHEGHNMDMNVKLAELPTQQDQARSGDNNSSDNKALDGINVENLSSQTARQLGISPSTTGVVVTQIDPSSSLAQTGLQRGDVIQEVNHRPVKNVSEFEQAMQKAGDNPLLLVNRKGTTLFMAK
jgi:serine protease Do